MIGRGDLIDAFAEENKVDSQLPLSPDDVARIFQTAHASHLAPQFAEKQHRFCPARFEYQRPANWNKDVVIPICNKTPINEGGTAHLWLIDVPEDFVETGLRMESQRSRFNAAPPGSDPDWRYEFALKTFTSRDQKVFENERNAFDSLKGHKGMVKYLASFKNVETNHTTEEKDWAASPSLEHHSTGNILLEFADMDLSVYFQNRQPPALSKEVEEFWKALFAIAVAVKDIHNFKENRGGEIREYHGWHSDIKPDNILNVEDTGTGICKFKLADPGFTQFESKNKHTNIPKLRLWGGTKTYGPPEYPGESDQPVSQAIDIWSLGCVFSLAATWAILGYIGVLEFNEVRKMANQELNRSHQAPRQADEDPDGDQFHDGYQVLEDVRCWHEYLRGRLRKCDAISGQVLDLIDTSMLITNPDERIKADELCSQLNKILARSSRDSIDKVPMGIQKKLKEIDAAVANRLESMRHSKGAEPVIVNGTTQGSRKLTPIDLMLKTTHRQSILPSNKGQIQNGRQSTSPKAEANLESPPHGSEKNMGMRHRGSDQSRSTPTRRASKKSSRHPPQNVFQAREAVMNRDKGNIKLLSKFSKQHQPRKDDVLENYFDQRDIIFLVDNAESMKNDWFQATYLLETLVMKAFGQDPDGMDLSFTTGSVKIQQQEKSSVFVNKMKQGYPKPGVGTNMVESLSKIFDQYLTRLRSSKSRTKDVTLIVLTDGLWSGTTRKDGVKDKIVELLAGLDRVNHNMKHRPFSIEFVQFGFDEDATRRLKDLDNFLRENKTGKSIQDPSSKYKDMIDTEHASGDVNKMLLGSFVEAYDEDEEDESDFDYPELDDASPGADERRWTSPPSNGRGINRSHTQSWSQPPPPQPGFKFPPSNPRDGVPYRHAHEADLTSEYRVP
ncbi:MAG: hypothetical protein Q9201_006328 [Fulgogasparrea decipioides]